MRHDIQIPEAGGLVQVGTGPYSALVLAECENDMWLASVRFQQPPQAGLTFHFRGTVWQLTWADTVGCTAKPLVM